MSRAALMPVPVRSACRGAYECVRSSAAVIRDMIEREIEHLQVNQLESAVLLLARKTRAIFG